MYVLFDMIRKANVYSHDPFTGKGHHLYLSLILRTYDLSAVADPGKGPGGPARTPLFLGQSEARRAEKIRVWMTPPSPPPYPKVWIRHCLVCESNTHPRKFGNHVTVHCPSDRPSFAPQAHQYNVTQSTGMATQMQRKKIACPPELLVIKTTTTTTKSRLSTLFLMFTLMSITEKELGRRISLEEKHKNFIAAVRKWEMLAARWKWAAVKNKSEHEHRK